METPVLGWDYAFLRPLGGEVGSEAPPDQTAHSPVLSIRDRKSQSCFWYLLPQMGTDFTLLEALVTKIVDDLNSLAISAQYLDTTGLMHWNA